MRSITLGNLSVPMWGWASERIETDVKENDQEVQADMLKQYVKEIELGDKTNLSLIHILQKW